MIVFIGWYLPPLWFFKVLIKGIHRQMVVELNNPFNKKTLNIHDIFQELNEQHEVWIRKGI